MDHLRCSWLQIKYLITLTLYMILTTDVVSTQNTASCDFFKIFNSSEAYRLDPRAFWHMSEDPLQQEPHKITKWTISSEAIWVSNGWTQRDFRTVASYKLYCVENLSENPQKILLRMNEAEGNGMSKYVCMQLTLRSPIIFQVKLSGVASSVNPPRDLCLEDSLVDTGMTFVDFEDSGTSWNEYIKNLVQYVPCPIHGGYVITSWQDETGSTKCANPQEGNLRVEDECEKGEGIVFSEGVTSGCKNPVFGELYQGDVLRCFSRWSDQNYDYAIAMTPFPMAAYCIRVPKKKNAQMEVYFFKDGICDYTSDIRHSKKFIKMQLMEHKIPGVCSDASPWCQSNNLETEDMKNLCAATAGACSSSNLFWKDLTVPSSLQGNWYRETEALGDGKIQITNQIIDSTHLGVWRFAGQAECAIGSHGLQEKGSFYLLISMADNGCRPRVALMWLLPFSKSVLGFQLSHSSIVNPVLNNTFGLTPAVLCSYPSLYFGGLNSILKDRYHVSAFGWYNLVNTDESLPLAECDISNWKQMQVTIKEGQSCTVSLKQENPKRFSVVVQSCNKAVEGLILDKPIQHDCMAQYKGRHGWRSFLVTRTPEDQNNLGKRKYICWLFSNEQPRAYIMPVGDCNDETVSEISDVKWKTPLVELSLTSPTAGRGTLLASSILLIVSLGFISQILMYYSG